MHIIENIPIEIRKEEVLKSLGYYRRKKSELTPPIDTLVEEAMKKAGSLIHAKGVYIILPVEAKTKSEIVLKNITLEKKTIVKVMAKAEEIAFFVNTIGPALESEVDRLYQRDEYTKATILDTIGSVAADDGADYLNSLIVEKVGKKATTRFSPGYGDWDLNIQERLLTLTQAAKIGVRCNESFFMVPRKSVSAVIGLY
jgi:cobalamin-dependent methionine synthase I